MVVYLQLRYRFALILMSVLVMGMCLAEAAFAAQIHVAQSPQASDQGPGTKALPYHTISKAAQMAQPGDEVIVHAGTYREWVQPARGGTGPTHRITYTAAKGDTVIMSGAALFSPQWKKLEPDNKTMKHVLYATIPQSLLIHHPRSADPESRYNPFNIAVRAGIYALPKERFAAAVSGKTGLRPLVIGQVFAGGKPLEQCRTLDEVKAMPGRWCVEKQGTRLTVHFPLYVSTEVELSVRPQVFAPNIRGLAYITVRGFIIEKAANQAVFPQAGMLSTRSGQYWIIENNIIREAATVGLDVGSEVIAHWKILEKQDINEGPWAQGVNPPKYEMKLPGGKFTKDHIVIDAPAPSRGHIIQNNLICDNGLSGLIAVKADGLLIQNNVVTRNNRCRLAPQENADIYWEEASGIKLHLTQKAIITRNLVVDNYGMAAGIWLDNNNDAAQITRNLVVGNRMGIDLEIDCGPAILVANNVVMFNRIDGLSSRDSNSVRFVNNLSAYNGRWGCIIGYTGGRGDYFRRHPHRPTHSEVSNNVFVGNHKGAIRFPMPNDKDEHNRISGNIAEPGTLFQLSSGGSKGSNALQMKQWVTAKIGDLLAKQHQSQFEDWSTQKNWWSRGRCNMTLFNAVFGENACSLATMELTKLSAKRTRVPDLDRGQEGSPYWQIQLGYSPLSLPKVKSILLNQLDYMGHSMAVDTCYPGPFQTDMAQQTQLWPQ
ncbi:MAG: right-handed parallel beta-helix repeat-containing protein [Phycisphaeraceae bacterium]|nr:right-handed parallel beta-helix repeat-containing protein [Phycisphaeraceae bacterium]